MKSYQRNIDTVTTSMTVLELNNMISSMRKVMKRARVQVIHKLTNQIKIYRKKRGSEDQVNANKKKSDRLVEEIHAIKKADLDSVIKFALSNTLTLQDVCNRSLMLRTRVKLCSQKIIRDKIDKWRNEHEDWKSLAAFIQQHTSRRMKQTKSTDESSNKKEEKTPKKIKNSERGSSAARKDSDSCSSDDDANFERDNNRDSKHDMLKRTTPSLKVSNKSKKVVKTQADIQPSKTIDCSDSDSVSADSESNSESSTEHILEANTVGTDTKASKDEVVVQRLNLQDIKTENEDRAKDDISFLFQTVSDNKLDSEVTTSKEHKSNKRKDPFFMFEENDDTDDTCEESGDSEEVEDHEGESETATNLKAVQKARKRVESTFLGSLSQAKPQRKKVKTKQSRWEKRADRPSSKPEAKKTYTKGSKPKSKPQTKPESAKSSKTSFNEHLHPSWEASKRRKLGLQIKPFEGKKIVFAD